MEKKKDLGFFKKHNIKWVIIISIWTFLLAAMFTILSERLVESLDTFMAFVVLILIILVGIIFDIIGIAVASADEKPFHSMAANKVNEAKHAIKLVRNASQVSNFCNDVIGDISGIISGAIGAMIVYNLSGDLDGSSSGILSIVLTSFIASMTVGGKAFGKSLGIIYSNQIIFNISKLLNFMEAKFGVDLFPNKKKGKK